jgi:hypothetical protein
MDDDELDLHELGRAEPSGKKSGLEVLYARYICGLDQIWMGYGPLSR